MVAKQTKINPNKLHISTCQIILFFQLKHLKMVKAGCVFIKLKGNRGLTLTVRIKRNKKKTTQTKRPKATNAKPDTLVIITEM